MTTTTREQALEKALHKCIAALERTHHATEADRLAAADEARAALALPAQPQGAGYTVTGLAATPSPSPKAEPVPSDQAKWCEYVAGMVDTWLRMCGTELFTMEPERREKAIAGIISRRLWALKAEPVRVPEDVMRAAFEAEISDQDTWGHRSLKKKRGGEYQNWCVNLMWSVWQSATLTAAKAQEGGVV